MTLTADPAPATDARAARHAARERTATRLLASSAKHSFDPLTDVDWDAPIDPEAWWMPPEDSSLYGTPLWESLTQAQRIEVTKHEFASILGVGIWFEEILMVMLLKQVYRRDATTAHVQYALTEIADECRHSTMFAQLITTMGSRCFGPGQRRLTLGRIFQNRASSTQTFAGAMFVEEILDAFQRAGIKDGRLQTQSHQVCKIHVTEEARHIAYARDELSRYHHRGLVKLGERLMLGFVAWQATDALIHPAAYAAAGLDPVEASRQAKANPAWRATKVRHGKKVLSHLDDAGLIGRSNRWMFRRAGLLPA